MKNDFDLKGYLLNNQLLKEAVEEAKEAKEEIKEMEEMPKTKMKKSELKEKIREEIKAAMAAETVAEAEEDEDEDIAADVDIDVDADLDMEEPAMDEPEGDDPFGDVGEESVEGAEQEAYDAVVAAGRAYKKLGEEADNGGLKTMMDQLAYLDRVYNYPPKEDVFNDEA